VARLANWADSTLQDDHVNKRASRLQKHAIEFIFSPKEVRHFGDAISVKHCFFYIPKTLD
jgi:hypothetical protein